jgi:hypothetical protein
MPGYATHLFHCLAGVVHSAHPLGGRQTQLLNQERQIDPVLLSSLDLAPGCGVS